MILGSPVGSPEYVRAFTRERMEKERHFLSHLPHLPDLQCAWLFLPMCAAPRANHLLRSLPPSLAEAYGEAHDEALWEVLQCFPGGTVAARARPEGTKVGRATGKTRRAWLASGGAHRASSVLGVVG